MCLLLLLITLIIFAVRYFIHITLLNFKFLIKSSKKVTLVSFSVASIQRFLLVTKIPLVFYSEKTMISNFYEVSQFGRNRDLLKFFNFHQLNQKVLTMFVC